MDKVYLVYDKKGLFEGEEGIREGSEWNMIWVYYMYVLKCCNERLGLGVRGKVFVW